MSTNVAARVDGVETILVDLPTIRPHRLSMHTMNSQTLVLVMIRCSDGTVGIGEGTTIGGLSYGEESPEGIKLVNRRSNLTPYRLPILTPLSGSVWR